MESETRAMIEAMTARLAEKRSSWRDGEGESRQGVVALFLEFAEVEGFADSPAADAQAAKILSGYEEPELALANAKCHLLDLRLNRERIDKHDSLHERDVTSHVAYRSAITESEAAKVALLERAVAIEDRLATAMERIAAALESKGT